jgi:protein SCO1/2
VSLADFRGKAVLIYFGYTWCPDVCPTNLALLAIALRQLTPEERPRVQVLFVSVDPQRDTPLRLAQYTAYFHPGMIGLTGDSEQVARVAAQYGAVYHRVETPDSAAGYLVDHSSHTYLVGPGGRLRRVLGHATPPAQTLRALREVLREGA